MKWFASLVVLFSAALGAAVMYERSQDPVQAFWVGGGVLAVGCVLVLLKTVVGAIFRLLMLALLFGLGIIAVVALLESRGLIFDEPVVLPYLGRTWSLLTDLWSMVRSSRS